MLSHVLHFDGGLLYPKGQYQMFCLSPGGLNTHDLGSSQVLKFCGLSNSFSAVFFEKPAFDTSSSANSRFVGNTSSFLSGSNSTGSTFRASASCTRV